MDRSTSSDSNSPGIFEIDVGTSKLIADGKIKLKNDSPISTFTPTGLKFENGTTLDADVVIFATGYTNVRDPIEKLCGKEVTSKLKTIWGLNEEGEIRSAWRDTGVEGLYVMMGEWIISLSDQWVQKIVGLISYV